MLKQYSSYLEKEIIFFNVYVLVRYCLEGIKNKLSLTQVFCNTVFYTDRTSWFNHFTSNYNFIFEYYRPNYFLPTEFRGRVREVFEEEFVCKHRLGYYTNYFQFFSKTISVIIEIMHLSSQSKKDYIFFRSLTEKLPHV